MIAEPITDKNCDICTIVHSDSDDLVLFKSKFWRIVLNANQNYLGRSFVTLLTHKTSLSELTNEEWLDFKTTATKLENAAKKAFVATYFNWACLMNDAYKNSKPTPHVHWHLIPRYKQKVIVSGVDFEDSEYGSNYKNEDAKVSKTVLEEIGERLKEQL